ncbi:hypothetical protein J2X90_000722 [Variovorax paradoxus]|nr:hypothetical protein [Variovorax paradoxus]
MAFFIFVLCLITCGLVVDGAVCMFTRTKR